MTRLNRPPTRRVAHPRALWRAAIDRGAVAAAFAMIVWLLVAGLVPDAPSRFDTAATPLSPVAAKAP